MIGTDRTSLKTMSPTINHKLTIRSADLHVQQNQARAGRFTIHETYMDGERRFGS